MEANTDDCRSVLLPITYLQGPALFSGTKTTSRIQMLAILLFTSFSVSGTHRRHAMAITHRQILDIDAIRIDSCRLFVPVTRVVSLYVLTRVVSLSNMMQYTATHMCRLFVPVVDRILPAFT